MSSDLSAREWRELQARGEGDDLLIATMTRVGLFLLVSAAGVAIGYAGYLAVHFVVLNEDAPWPLRIALPVGGIGMLLILAGVGWESLRMQKNSSKEIERAQP